MLLLRNLMKIGCEPGKVGAMATGTSPLDPIFWVLHTGFEKANHILQLSPSYRDTYDFTWVDGGCNDGVSGGAFDDYYPFSGLFVRSFVRSFITAVVFFFFSTKVRLFVRSLQH